MGSDMQHRAPLTQRRARGDLLLAPPVYTLQTSSAGRCSVSRVRALVYLATALSSMVRVHP
jgi:hypothetical protein